MNLVSRRSVSRCALFLCIPTALIAGACNASAHEALAPIRFASIAGSLVPAQTAIPKGYGIVPYGNGSLRISAPAGACDLTYYGGPLVSNVQVVPVIWGSFVNAQVTATIAQFYADATISPWYDFLSEYASVGGTNQSIGRGSAVAAVTITPSKCASSSACSMTDADLQAELVAQINAGHLPAPQPDGAGHTNTAYMVHFPSNIALTGPGDAPSCAAGGFCSYHGTTLFGAGNTHLPYAAIMDTFTGGCSLGCGSGAAFDNETSSSSHQLAELVTDTDVGLAATVAYPLGWYNSSCGEIADICNQQAATITVSNRTWTVQKQWSNAQASCVSTGTPPNFAVSAPATTPAGTAFAFGVTARNPYTNSTDIAYVGTVHFTSSDPGAVLPADFTFAPEDMGTASLNATMTSLGSKTITATDTLNGAIVGTSAAISVTAAADGTTLSTACPTTFVENQSIALTAMVSNGVNPTGTVTFADGPTVFCSNVSLVSGAASCQTPTLALQGGGTSSVYHPVASYSGDGSNSPSASSSLPLTILAAADVVFRAAFDPVVVGCPAY